MSEPLDTMRAVDSLLSQELLDNLPLAFTDRRLLLVEVDRLTAENAALRATVERVEALAQDCADAPRGEIAPVRGIAMLIRAALAPEGGEPCGELWHPADGRFRCILPAGHEASDEFGGHQAHDDGQGHLWGTLDLGGEPR